jgi:alpha-L-fucosidase
MTDKTQWFREARFGLFIHWGIYSIPAKGEWALFHNGWDYDYYERFAKDFNPVQFDPEQWADLAWRAGMRYVVFTTKHHDGFCMFDSKFTEFKITNTPYKKDITRMVAEAFRKRGHKVGFYHSLVDWRHPHFIPDAEHPLWNKGERDFSSRDISKHKEYLFNHVRQLLTEYGKVDLLFFDYTSKYKTSDEWDAEKLLDLVHSLQPEIIVNDRLSYHKTPRFYGDYATPEVSVPNAQIKIDGKDYDWETCMTMNSSWGYSGPGTPYKSSQTVLEALVRCASLSGNLLLNAGPDAYGRIPEGSVQILEDCARWMKEHEESVRGAGKAAFTAPHGMVYTQKDKSLYLQLFTPPMGDIILPGLADKIKDIRLLADGSDVPMITHWGGELLRDGDIRIRPPFAVPPMSVLKINLK